MIRHIVGGKNYPNNDILAAAGTAQLLAAGAEATTFAVPVKFITVTYADKATWIAKSQAEAGATAGGAEDDRIFVAAGTVDLRLPWSGQVVYFVNAVATETPAVYVVGHV